MLLFRMQNVTEKEIKTWTVTSKHVYLLGWVGKKWHLYSYTNKIKGEIFQATELKEYITVKKEVGMEN